MNKKQNTKNRLSKEELTILSNLTQEQKNKYLIWSQSIFITISVLGIIAAPYFTYLAIKMSIPRRHIFGGTGATLAFCIIGLIMYIKSPTEKKIVDAYHLIHERVIITEKKIRVLLWFAIFCIILMLICPFFYIIVSNKIFSLYAFLLCILGIVVSFIIWFYLLSKKDTSKKS